jgi:hypothetical protein
MMGVASVLNKKTGVFFGILLLGLIVAIPLRTCVILFDIDPKTGFYFGSSNLVLANNILLVIITALLLVPMLLKGYKKLDLAPGRSVGIGVISAVLAALFCIDSVHEFYLVVLKLGGAGVFFNSIFEIVAAVFFVLYALASFKGNGIAFPVASLLPVLWATVHLMVSFMHYTTVVNISDYLFDMLKMVFVMLFFYYHARYAGRVTNGNEIKGMLSFGLPAVFFTLVCILPRYIAMAYGQAVTIDYSDDLLFVALSVYITAVLISVFFKRSPAVVGGVEGNAVKS